MSWVKDASNYADSVCPAQNYSTVGDHAAALYTAYSESLRSLCGSPYKLFSQLEKDTQKGWIDHAKKLKARMK